MDHHHDEICNTKGWKKRTRDMTIICKVYRKASKSFVSSRQCRSLKLGGGEIVVEARDMAVAPESYDVFGSCHFHFVRGKIVASRRI